MKSYHVNEGGGLASLMLKEHDVPTPGPHEVLIRIRASSFNYREFLILQGNYPVLIKPDVIPLCDGAGEVVAVGPDVTRTKIGDRVTTGISPSWLDGPFPGWETYKMFGGSLDGFLTEYAVLSEETILPIPGHLSFEEAAALPCAALAAWSGLMAGGRPLQVGETVLTLGASSVSLFALQFAKSLGARVIATTSSEEKVKRLKALGADEVINYRTTPNWHEVVRVLTGDRGVDLVVETIGASTLEQSIKATALEGQVAQVGWLPSNVSTLDISVLAMAAVTLRPVLNGSRAQFLAMNHFISQHQLKPVIDRVFPFEKAKDAYSYCYYEGRQHFGKVIISQSSVSNR